MGLGQGYRTDQQRRDQEGQGVGGEERVVAEHQKRRGGEHGT